MVVGNKVFNRIALSLSGGGYRAAAFHLGALKTLHQLKLLENVNALSTVSGGTIIGAAYAGSLADKVPFEDFVQQFYDFLKTKNVITRGLAKIQESTRINNEYRMPSLIRAAASVYADDLLGDKMFSSLLNDKSTHLKEISFNATDFRSGNCFRFQKSSSDDVRTGNNNCEVDPQVNELIRLADIVAASSCFPSGFEPIRFPSDFVWPRDGELSEISKNLGRKFREEIPLMDGGVFDNQGIDSIENIHNREGAEIDLYIISDTDQRNEVLLKFPIKNHRGRISLKTINLFVWILLLLSVITFSAIIWNAAGDWLGGNLTWGKAAFLYFIPLIFTAGVIFLIVWGRLMTKKIEKLILEKIGFEVWDYLKKLTVPEIVDLVDSRVKSLIAMSISVFMKRIRNLGYNRIFADPNYQTKIMPNIIYDLDNESRWGQEIIGANLQPSEKLRSASRNAEAYSTNLWFLEQTDLDNLIYCGQATMSFKILKHLLRYKSAQILVKNSPEAKLFEDAKSTYLEMNK